MESFVYSSYCY